MKRLHAAPDGVAQIDHQMAEMAAGVAQVFNVQHTSPTEMAGMYVLASTMGMVPTLSASEIVARLGLRYVAGYDVSMDTVIKHHLRDVCNPFLRGRGDPPPKARRGTLTSLIHLYSTHTGGKICWCRCRAS